MFYLVKRKTRCNKKGSGFEHYLTDLQKKSFNFVKIVVEVKNL